MKIAIVTSMSGYGGTENVSVRLCKLFMAQGHELVLLSSAGPLVDDVVSSGCAWFEADFYSGGILGYLRATYRTAKMLRKERPQVLDCQMARPVIACWLASHLSGVRVGIVWHSRGLRAQTYPKISPLFSRLGVFAIGNCQRESEKLVRHGYRADRTTFSYNPLPVMQEGAPRPSGQGFVIGSLSRLSPDRSVDEALLLTKALADLKIDVRLIVAGDGPERMALEQLASELGIAERVQFLGRISNLHDFFPHIDLMINTYKGAGDEGAGVGNNVLEAALFRVPVVAYDSCGIAEIVLDGKTGFCVPIGDQATYIERLVQLAGDSDARRQLGAALYGHVKAECASEKIYADTFGVYQKAAFTAGACL